MSQTTVRKCDRIETGPETKTETKTKSKSKIRNYSFLRSKRLPPEKQTEINGIKIPAIPGSCYHAIICTLAANKGTFVKWEKLELEVEKYMCIYGGNDVWNQFINKKGKKNYHQRIKENTHTLTRHGRDCYGFRLHERGMSIYFFRDGCMLLTGGQLIKTKSGYDVKFSDNRKLQNRHRGRTMSYSEYIKFLEENWINKSGEILNADAIKKYRQEIKLSDIQKESYLQM